MLLKAIDPLTVLRTKMHLRLGGLMVPAKDVIHLTAKHAHPLLFDNKDKDHPLAVAGSSFLFTYRGRFIQVSSRHQITNLGRDPGDVRLVDYGQKPLIIPPRKASGMGNQVRALNNMQDLLAFQYELPADATIRHRFLNIAPSQFVSVPPAGAKQIFAYYFIGFPSQAVGYEISSESGALEHLKNRWIRLLLEPDTTTLRLVPNRLYMKSLDSFESMKIDPDGISGAPVFVVYQTHDDQCRFAFCGIITDANKNGVVAVYDAQPMQLFLDLLQ
jgi:hypothetical protein